MPKQVYDAVRKDYQEQFKVEWTEPLGFNNTFVIVVRGDDAEKTQTKNDLRRGTLRQTVDCRVWLRIHRTGRTAIPDSPNCTTCIFPCHRASWIWD
jgi:hypothetical protein